MYPPRIPKNTSQKKYFFIFWTKCKPFWGVRHKQFRNILHTFSGDVRMDKYNNKFCIKCNAEITDENVSWKNKKAGSFRYICKSCYNEHNRKYFHENKNRNRDYVDDFLSKGCCKCGESNTWCLDAHHINPEEKDMNISILRKTLHSLDRIKAELDKCIVLCSNCHREFHYFQELCGVELESYLDDSFDPNKYEE